MVIALWMIAVLILVSVVSLIKFMRNMALVEDALIRELKEVKGVLQKIHEKQL